MVVGCKKSDRLIVIINRVPAVFLVPSLAPFDFVLSTMRVLALLALAGGCLGYNNGMARLPPMGWNTWCGRSLSWWSPH